MKINHDQLENLIKTSYEKKVSLFITGGIGIGKSDSVRGASKKLAEKNNLSYGEDNHYNDENIFRLIDVRVAQLDAVDLRGIPHSDHDTQTIKWFPPDWLPKTGKGILFFDELNLATPSIMSACFQLILDRKLGNYSLPEGFSIVAAGNRIQDRSTIFELPAPLANRFIHCELDPPNIDQWTEWSINNNIDSRIISFLNFSRSSLYKFTEDSVEKAFPTPRCVRGDSLIRLVNGSQKPITDINIGDKVIGFENGEFVEATVLNKFETKVNKQFEVTNSKNKLVCSGEHKFLTDVGYVNAKNLNSAIPTYLYEEVSSVDSRRSKFSSRESKQNNIQRNSQQPQYNRTCSNTKSDETWMAEMETATKDSINEDGIS